MRIVTTRLTALAAATALLGTSATVALATTGHPTVTRAPRLSLVKRSPLTIKGINFPKRTRVTFTLSSARTTRRTLTTTSTGTFTVTFTSGVDRCTQWMATVTRRGAAPVRLRGPKPLCAPAGGYGGY
jgi:hypothetical protein